MVSVPPRAPTSYMRSSGEGWALADIFTLSWSSRERISTQYGLTFGLSGRGRKSVPTLLFTAAEPLVDGTTELESGKCAIRIICSRISRTPLGCETVGSQLQLSRGAPRKPRRRWSSDRSIGSTQRHSAKICLAPDPDQSAALFWRHPFTIHPNRRRTRHDAQWRVATSWPCSEPIEAGIRRHRRGKMASTDTLRRF